MEVLGASNSSELKYATSTNIWMLLFLEGSSLTASGQPSATGLDAITTLNECNYSNYSRQRLTGLSYTYDSTARVGRWKFDPVTYPTLGTSTTPVVGALIYQGTSSTGKPLHVFDTRPLFPFYGGGDKVIVAPTGGAVRVEG